MDPSIKSVLDRTIQLADVNNNWLVANYLNDFHFWKAQLPIYAACLPPVKGPDEPVKPRLKRINAPLFEKIYLEYNASRSGSLANPGGDVDISTATYYEVYEPEPEAIAPVQKQPRNPIGVLISNEDDDVHAPAPGDMLPSGTIYTMVATGMTYQKMKKKANAMGLAPSVWVPFGV